MTFILTDADCKGPEDGYHFDVWAEICTAFGLRPSMTDSIEVRYYDHSVILA